MKTPWIALWLLFLAAPLSQAASKPIRILFLGDSLTEGYGLDPASAYPALVEEALKKEGLSVQAINAGTSGSTTSSAISRLRWHLRAKPDILVLALGANDGLRGVPVKDIRKNLEDTLQAAKAQGLTTLLVGMRVPPNYGGPYATAFDGLFGELARKYKTPFVPFLLEGVAGEKALNLADGIHPNEEGQKRMAALLTKALKPLIHEKSRE